MYRYIYIKVKKTGTTY